MKPLLDIEKMAEQQKAHKASKMYRGLFMSEARANEILAACGCSERVNAGDPLSTFLLLYTEQIAKRLDNVESNLSALTSISNEVERDENTRTRD